MKRKWFVFLLIFVLVMGSFQTVFADDGIDPTVPKNEGNFDSTPPTQTQNTLKLTPVLANGNFELGSSSWSEYSSNGIYPVITIPTGVITPRSGSYVAWLGGTVNELTQVYQLNFTISNPTGINFWYWIGSQDTCGNDIGQLSIDGIPVVTWNLCSANNTFGWVEFSYDLSAYNGQTIDIIISATTNGTLNSNFFIDDVSLYKRFADVPNGGFGDDYIESIYNAGITGGCQTSPVLKYCPDGTVTRAQMAIFLLRGINYPSPYIPPGATGTVFNDVSISSFGAAFIEAFSAAGITGGCGGGNYCPDSSVTRGQMAVFLLRAKYTSSYDPPAATGTMFSDVPISHPFVEWIEQLATEGITGGCGSGNYCPDNPVTRAQMAIFIQRTFNLPLP